MIPNFYPPSKDPSASPFEIKDSKFTDLEATQRAAQRVPDKKVAKKVSTSRKTIAPFNNVKKGKFETENAPKIPKLNLGKLKTNTKNDFYSKNISEYDDTSLGDYEMILRNQKFAINSSKDPSIITASKSQNN